MARSVLLDAGPLVAYLIKEDEYHSWAIGQFGRFARFYTCEAVLAEACARLSYYDKTPAIVMELVAKAEASVILVNFQIKSRAERIARLMRKYADQPMDLADACLVVMSEQAEDSLVLTTDRTDFTVYRRHDREPIPFVSPGD
jgi:uncharacterized protein